jgi:hypothetical protein
MTTKRILAFLHITLLALTWASAGETSYHLDASVCPASSPVSWKFEGVSVKPADKSSSKLGGLPVMVLDPAQYHSDVGTDLLLHFDGDATHDETGNWRIEAQGAYTRASPELAYMGAGAAAFRAPGSQLNLYPDRSSIFGANAVSGDFSIEFWLYPANAESGEILLLWKGARRDGSKTTTQQVSVIVSRNHLVFAFTNFFAPAGGGASQVNLSGTSLLVPRIWSHHLVRFDSSTGLLEYLMNGVTEATAYMTRTGREGGEVFLPSVGAASPVVLGPNYTGLLDELRVSTRWIDKPTLGRYGLSSGRATSPIVDLGWANSELKSIAAEIRTPGNSGAAFFFRSGDTPETWREETPEWRPFNPGEPLPADARGRYAQVRIEFYPDPRGGAGPILTSLTLHYLPDLPPPPPSEILAIPGDGRITVRWTRVPDADLKGYMVYYGYAPGEYYGADSFAGQSPVDAGNSTSLTLTGLTNGRLYYITVASYDAVKPLRPGEFSEEAAARPVRTVP